MRKETQHSADIKVFLFFGGLKVKLSQYHQNHYTDLRAKYYAQMLQVHTVCHLGGKERQDSIK